MTPPPLSLTIPSCSGPPPSNPNPNLSTHPPEHLTLNIKITHPSDTTTTTDDQTPNPPSITAEILHNSIITDQQPPAYTPSPILTALTALTALTSKLSRLETTHALLLESQAKQTRASQKQHARVIKKLNSLDGILTCIHDEFHGDGEGCGKRMCERVEEVVGLLKGMKGMGAGSAKGGDGEGRIRRVVA